MRQPQQPRPRAQGTLVVPVPPGISLDHDNCLVALEAVFARERGDGAVYAERTISRVGWGAAYATLEELVCETYRDPDEDGGDCAARRVLLFEIAALGDIDPHCPLHLERRLAFDDGRREFVEAMILPFGEADATELSALLRGPGGARDRHEAAMRYARELEERWAACCPAGELPLRYLRVDIPARPRGTAPVRPGTDPVADHEQGGSSQPAAEPAAV